MLRGHHYPPVRESTVPNSMPGTGTAQIVPTNLRAIDKLYGMTYSKSRRTGDCSACGIRSKWRYGVFPILLEASEALQEGGVEIAYQSNECIWDAGHAGLERSEDWQLPYLQLDLLSAA